MMRQIFVFIHRRVGLAMTIFLILVGLTGSLLAFHDDLEKLVTPQFFATPRPGEPRLDLHFALASGSIGFGIMGIVATVWTFDCFVGFYLTLPVTTAGFWRRWKPSWLVKWPAGAYRHNFDLHRASGLWLWPMLLIFAWSSVYLAMPTEPLYRWVMQAISDLPQLAEPAPKLNEHPRLGWRAAEKVGTRVMAEQASIRDFRATGEAASLSYVPSLGQYYFSVLSSLDVARRDAQTTLAFDGDSGALTFFMRPMGEHSSVTVTNWLGALHKAAVFGLPYRIFVCALGFIITMLSVTGVYIWWKKCKARLQRKSRPSGNSIEQRGESSACV